MKEYAIEVEHLSCKIGYKYLLHDITWRVKPGEHWVVFGMNGCGKTTLLSCIAGFRQYTDAQIKIHGECFTNETVFDVRRRIGWVSSSFFDKHYTRESALDIVLSSKYGTLALNGYATAADIKLARELLMELHLGERLYYTFDMLSKGERQNVLIARALFSKPDILVLDEPCTGLDIYNREYLFQTIDRLAKRQDMTIIYVTHYVEEISSVFDRCLLLKHGRVFAAGLTQELFQAEKIGELLGYPVELHQEMDQTLRLKVPNVRSNIGDFCKNEKI